MFGSEFPEIANPNFFWQVCRGHLANSENSARFKDLKPNFSLENWQKSDQKKSYDLRVGLGRA
jgi:hypothetical protein